MKLFTCHLQGYDHGKRYGSVKGLLIMKSQCSYEITLHFWGEYIFHGWINNFDE